jgi:hypothetical protein
VPQDGGEGQHAARARARMAQVVDRLISENLIAAGMIGDPDPFTAVMNAVGYFYISEIVISTLPDYQSKWLENGLVDRIKRQTGKPVLHVASSDVSETATAASGS